MAASMHWQFRTLEKCPSAREGHSMTLDERTGRIYLFGGMDGHGKKLNELFFLNTKTLQWVKPLTHGHPPIARAYHTAVIVGRQLVIYGGDNDAEVEKALDDVSKLDLETMSWTCNMRQVPGPLPRLKHSATTIVGDAKKPRMFVFGGTPHGAKGQARSYHGLHILDFESMCWYKPQTSGHVPRGSLNHSAVLGSEGRFLYVFGGYSDSQGTGQSFVLDSQTLRWERQTTDVPPNRNSHVACRVEDFVWVLGGKNGGDKAGLVDRDDFVVCLDANQLRWVHPDPLGECPTPRYGHAAVALDSRIFLFGGMNAYGEPCNDNFYILETNLDREAALMSQESCGPDRLSSLIMSHRSLKGSTMVGDETGLPVELRDRMKQEMEELKQEKDVWMAEQKYNDAELKKLRGEVSRLRTDLGNELKHTSLLVAENDQRKMAYQEIVEYLGGEIAALMLRAERQQKLLDNLDVQTTEFETITTQYINALLTTEDAKRKVREVLERVGSSYRARGRRLFEDIEGTLKQKAELQDVLLQRSDDISKSMGPITPSQQYQRIEELEREVEGEKLKVQMYKDHAEDVTRRVRKMMAVAGNAIKSNLRMASALDLQDHILEVEKERRIRAEEIVHMLAGTEDEELLQKLVRERGPAPKLLVDRVNEWRQRAISLVNHLEKNGQKHADNEAVLESMLRERDANKGLFESEAKDLLAESHWLLGIMGERIQELEPQIVFESEVDKDARPIPTVQFEEAPKKERAETDMSGLSTIRESGTATPQSVKSSGTTGLSEISASSVKPPPNKLLSDKAAQRIVLNSLKSKLGRRRLTAAEEERANQAEKHLRKLLSADYQASAENAALKDAEAQAKEKNEMLKISLSHILDARTTMEKIDKVVNEALATKWDIDRPPPPPSPRSLEKLIEQKNSRFIDNFQSQISEARMEASLQSQERRMNSRVEHFNQSKVAR